MSTAKIRGADAVSIPASPKSCPVKTRESEMVESTSEKEVMSSLGFPKGNSSFSALTLN